jgi:hypothetical protein
MRLIRISAPAGNSADIAKIAFSEGVDSVSVTAAQTGRQENEKIYYLFFFLGTSQNSM